MSGFWIMLLRDDGWYISCHFGKDKWINFSQNNFSFLFRTDIPQGIPVAIHTHPHSHSQTNTQIYMYTSNTDQHTHTNIHRQSDKYTNTHVYFKHPPTHTVRQIPTCKLQTPTNTQPPPPPPPHAGVWQLDRILTTQILSRMPSLQYVRNRHKPTCQTFWPETTSPVSHLLGILETSQSPPFTMPGFKI